MRTFQERWENLSEAEKDRFRILERDAYKAGAEVEYLERAFEARRSAATANEKAAKRNYKIAAGIFIVVGLLSQAFEWETTRIFLYICGAGVIFIMGIRNEVVALLETRNADEISIKMQIVKHSQTIMPFSYFGEGGEELRAAQKKVVVRLLNASASHFYSLDEFDD